MFQSHLYGIESANGYYTFGNGERFNRTFMELKAYYFKYLAIGE